MNKQNIQPDYTVKGAAIKVGTDERRIREAIKAGKLRAYKVSARNTRITSEALDEFRGVN